MELRFLHIYPDLMNLYGSYANISILKQSMEALGHTVTVEPVAPGQPVNPAGADFLFLGAGTERAQKFALEQLRPCAGLLKAAAEDGLPMLFAGTAMELLGRTITDMDGTVYEGLGLAAFSTVQGKTRIVEDVYGVTGLTAEPVVGFMNKCGIVSGVETPLLTSLQMGFGNEAERGPEGYHKGNVFASELTGPLLVKNPPLLQAVAGAILARRGEPAEVPVDPFAREGYDTTVRQLAARWAR